jgi:acyl-CoA hydrolase
MTQKRLLVIRPEHLNHRGHLFGGLMMSWADEQVYITATLAYPQANFVTRLFREFNFHAPAELGNIVEIQSEVIHAGNTSCTVRVAALNLTLGCKVFSTEAVMVNVQNGKKAPLSH